MPTWGDDFNRPDGLIGNGWLNAGDGDKIVSNRYVCEYQATIYHPSTADAGRHSVTMDIVTLGATSGSPMPMVKYDPVSGGGYHLKCRTYNGNIEIRLCRNDSNYWEFLEMWTGVGPMPATFTVNLTYDGGLLTVSYNGAQILSHSDNAHGDHLYSGMNTVWGGATVDNFNAANGDPASMVIVPDQAYILAGQMQFTAVGTYTDWDPGNQSDTTLSADHGSIVAQQIVDETHVSFILDVPQWWGVITITESKHGLTATITTTWDENAGGGPSAPISIEGSAILTRTGAYCPSGHMLTTCDEAEGITGAKITEILGSIAFALGGVGGQVLPSHQINSTIAQAWLILNGGVPAIPGTDVLGNAVNARIAAEAAQAQLTALRAAPYASLLDLAKALGGDPMLYSHADLNTAIGNALSAILAAVGAVAHTVQGLGDPTIADVIQVLNALAIALGDDIASVKGDTEHIPSVQTTVNDISTSLGSYRTGANYTVQDILNAIAGISVTVNTPPVVGVTGQLRTYLETIPYSQPFRYTLPCDGFVYTVPRNVVGAKGYQVGDRVMLTGAGGYAFTDEDGYAEPLQFVNSERGIALPRTMAHAGGFLWSPNIQCDGSVTPFVLS